jgi:hypothetical protein
MSAVVFNNKIWVQGGTDYDSSFKDTWFSNDGLTWTRAHIDIGFTRRRHKSVAFADKIWLIGGQHTSGNLLDENLTVAYSGNGVDWTESSAIPPFSTGEWLVPTTTVFQNKIWLIGGAKSSSSSNKAIWTSDNGLHWTERTNDNGMGGRAGHTAVVFNGKLWVIGGCTSIWYGRKYLHDVWVYE